MRTMQTGIIIDARNYLGILTCQIVGASLPGKLRRKSCIAVLNSIDYAWLADANIEPEIADDGKYVRFAGNGRTIQVDDILELSTIWHLRWSSSGLVDLPQLKELTGCWRTGSGFMLLHASGILRIMSVSKGLASENDGQWRWELLATDQLVLERLDVPDSNKAAYRQIIRLCRYDGSILELYSVSCFHLNDNGFPNISYLKREPRLPRLWRDLA